MRSMNQLASTAKKQDLYRMALIGTRVQAAVDGDNTVAVRTDVLLDPETGLMVERKTVVAEVLTESGNHKALLVGQRTSVAVTGPALYSRPQYRAIGSTPPQRPGGVPTSPENNTTLIHCCFCLMTVFFPPCIFCWLLYCCAIFEQ